MALQGKGNRARNGAKGGGREYCGRRCKDGAPWKTPVVKCVCCISVAFVRAAAAISEFSCLPLFPDFFIFEHDNLFIETELVISEVEAKA